MQANAPNQTGVVAVLYDIEFVKAPRHCEHIRAELANRSDTDGWVNVGVDVE
jgi:hypothetical protein